jgi:hypothetical protein
MTISLKTKIEKHSIRLPECIQIPDGAFVSIQIEYDLSKSQKRNLAENLCGSWSDDPSIKNIFNEIEKERHIYTGRIVEF